MPRIRTGKIVAAACLTAFAAGLGGCAQQLGNISEAQETGWFSKPMDLFRKPEWARLSSTPVGDLGPTGPVAPEEFVSADGQCAASATDVVASAPAPTPVSAPGGAGFDGGLQTGGAGSGPAQAPVAGGIALGMTECQTVRRAGTPSHVAISGEGGARRVVLTYNSGPWPGIYTFDSGRLKVVDEAPGQEKKPEKVKKPAKKTKTAASAKAQ